MKPSWMKYLLYVTVVIVGGSSSFILEETIRLKNTGFAGKTLWDWMELLVIPFVLALGAFLLNRSEKKIERQNIEARSNLEREIATDRQQEAFLQAYLDHMTDLLLNKNLRKSNDEDVSNVARIRTLTVLRELDSRRKGLVIQFLQDSELIKADRPVVYLNEVDLSRADLRHAYLAGAHLRAVILESADLEGAILNNANLSFTNLRAATLKDANLSSANLQVSRLDGANMQKAILVDANLAGASLRGAKLDGARLERTNLDGAIMPDGAQGVGIYP